MSIKETALPEGWKWTRIGEIANTASGGTPSRRNLGYYNGNIPWVKSGELCDGIIKQSEETISEEGLANSSAKVFPKGTLCIALYGATIGKLGILGINAATNQAVCGIFPTSAITTPYLRVFLESHRQYLMHTAKGGAQPNISQSILQNLIIPVPPLTEQHQIVAEIEKQFSRIDEGVVNLKRAQANIKRYKASVLKTAIAGRLVETEAERARRQDRNFETGEQLLQRILEMRRNQHQGKYKQPAPFDTTDLPKLPEGWAWTTMDQIAGINPQINKSLIPDNLPVSFVPMPAVGADNGYICVDKTRLAKEVKKGFTAFLEGDVLFAKITPCMENGKIAIVPKLVNDYGFGSTEFHVLRPLSGIDAKHIYYYISNQTFRNKAERNMTGAVGQRRVPTTYIKDSCIPVPPLTEQHRIVEEIERHLSVLHETETQINANLQRAKHLRQSILNQAFSGELCLNSSTSNKRAI